MLDADIYGFSVPRMLGVTGKPTQVEQMIMPPQAHGVKVISIGMFTPGNTAVVWRGPMLHRALQQFLADVFWGDLDVLLMDLPPGTGDIAISVAQLVPSAELLVVTTPQLAAREVAERAGSIALQTHQQIVGVVENMSWLELPDGSPAWSCSAAGGGQAVADSLSDSTGTRVPLLGQVPIDSRVREGGDDGTPIVLSAPGLPGRDRRSARSPTRSPAGSAAWSAGRSGLSVAPLTSPAEPGLTDGQRLAQPSAGLSQLASGRSRSGRVGVVRRGLPGSAAGLCRRGRCGRGLLCRRGRAARRRPVADRLVLAAQAREMVSRGLTATAGPHRRAGRS